MSCPCGVEPSNKDLMMEIRGVYDGALIIQCGVCGELRPRFNVPGSLHDRAVEIIQKWKAEA